MIPQNHHGKSLLTLLLLNTANYGSHAFSSQLAIHRPRHASRHASLLPPLRYLSSEDEREETDAKDNHAHNKKPRRSFIHSLDRLLTDLQMTQSHLRHHPFLSGNYAPVDKELVEVDVQVVEGQIPKSISGAFCRNGPNPKREWMRKRYHWFDGHAMLHTLMFNNGKATYTNQYIPSPRYQIEQELGEEYFPTIGEYVGVFGLIKVLLGKQLVKEKVDDGKMALPPNTSIIMYNNKLYCLHEAALPLECRMHRDGRLTYIGHETFDSALDYPFTAHPLKDGEDLLFHSYTTDETVVKEQGMMKLGIYKYQRNAVGPYFVPTDDKSHVSFAHSFAHTDNFIIVWDCSIQFQHDALVKGGSFFRFNPNRNMKFGLIPKSSTNQDDVIWIDCGEPGAILHSLHAWEEVEEKFLDGNKISSRTFIKLWTPLSQDCDMDFNQCSSFRMVEFTIDVEDEKAVHEVINHSINTEFPVMPPPLTADEQSDAFTSLVVFTPRGPAKNPIDKTETRCTGTLTSADRFGFSAIFVDRGVFVGYAKWDMLNRCLAGTVYYGDNEIGGEPVVLRGSKQDEMYVGSYVYNKDEDQSYFDLYDAKTNQRVCRLKMPQRVPQGFHGTYISGKDLESHFQRHEARSMDSDSELWDKLFRSSQEGY